MDLIIVISYDQDDIYDIYDIASCWPLEAGKVKQANFCSEFCTGVSAVVASIVKSCSVLAQFFINKWTRKCQIDMGCE